MCREDIGTGLGPVCVGDHGHRGEFLVEVVPCPLEGLCDNKSTVMCLLRSLGGRTSLSM